MLLFLQHLAHRSVAHLHNANATVRLVAVDEASAKVVDGSVHGSLVRQCPDVRCNAVEEAPTVMGLVQVLSSLGNVEFRRVVVVEGVVVNVERIGHQCGYRLQAALPAVFIIFVFIAVESIVANAGQGGGQAASPNSVTLLGMMTSVRLLHKLKASQPIVVSVLGSVRSAMAVHSKAPSPMVVNKNLSLSNKRTHFSHHRKGHGRKM